MDRFNSPRRSHRNGSDEKIKKRKKRIKKSKKDKKKKKSKEYRSSREEKKISKRLEKLRGKRKSNWSKETADLSKMSDSELGIHLVICLLIFYPFLLKLNNI